MTAEDRSKDGPGVLSFAKSPGMYLTTIFLTYAGLYTLLCDLASALGSTMGHPPPFFLYSLCLVGTSRSVWPVKPESNLVFRSRGPRCRVDVDSIVGSLISTGLRSSGAHFREKSRLVKRINCTSPCGFEWLRCTTGRGAHFRENVLTFERTGMALTFRRTARSLWGEGVHLWEK